MKDPPGAGGDAARYAELPDGHHAGMAGASDRTQRVSFINANWSPGSDGERGTFELHVVTEDGERHTLPLHGDDAAAAVALTQASGVMLFDPQGPTLIAANLAGEWLQNSWSSGDDRVEGTPHGA